jgi:hypothetical protein
LIVLVLQPWLSLAHTHTEVSEHDPSGKFRPPHFHLRFFSVFWRHSNEAPVSQIRHAAALTGGAAAPDHDIDAIYVPVSVLLGWDDGPRAETSIPPSDLVGTVSVCSQPRAFAPTAFQPADPFAALLAASPFHSRTLILLV